MILSLPALLTGCDRYLPPDPPVLDVRTEETVKDVPYEVSAATARQAHQKITEMSELLRLKSWSRETWNMKWGNRTKFYRGQCYLEEATITVELLGRAPVWTNAEDAS